MPPKNHKKKVYYIYIIKNLFYSSLQKIILIEIRNCEIYLTLIGSFLGLKQAFRDPLRDRQAVQKRLRTHPKKIAGILDNRLCRVVSLPSQEENDVSSAVTRRFLACNAMDFATGYISPRPPLVIQSETECSEGSEYIN